MNMKPAIRVKLYDSFHFTFKGLGNLWKNLSPKKWAVYSVESLLQLLPLQTVKQYILHVCYIGVQVADCF